MLDKSNTNVNHILPVFDYSYIMKLLQERIAFVKSITGWSNAELARQAGTSRTAPTDWLKGAVTDLASSTAQRLSGKTVFTATWLATGDGPMYKSSDAATGHRAESTQWPFGSISENKVRALSQKDLVRLETAVLAFAEKYRLDIADESLSLDIKKTKD